MNPAIKLRLAIISVVVIVLAAPMASTHPGGRDAQGCHVCNTNCEKWGVKDGERHCHMPDGKIYSPGEGVGPNLKKKPPRGPKEIIRYEFPTDKTVEGAFKAYVEKVSDGDTIKVRLLPSGEKQTVRILGIDCPESYKNAKCKRDGKAGRKGCDWQIPRGLKASKRAAELLKHKTVYLECSGKCRKGAYGRALRYVRLKNGDDFGLQMVREGLCEDFSWKYPHPRYLGYQEAQIEARQAGKGIWADEKLSPLFIGKGLAERLGVKKGDVVWIVVPPVRTPTNPPKAWFRIGGIFETGNMVLDEKRVCSTPEGLGPLRREKKLGIIEGIVSSQHNIMGVDAYELKEEEASAGGCKEALGVP